MTPKTTRTIRRTRAADLRRAARAEAARRQEERDEAVAPAAQRNAVLVASVDPDTGEAIQVTLRAARVQRDGVAFIRADPLRCLVDSAVKGGMFTAQHVAAAKRLITSWDEVGDGVGLGASDWGSLRGSRGTAPTEPAGHSSLVAQVAHRMEIEAAHAFIGALWPCLEGIMLRGMSIATWSARANLNRAATSGYLMAALDRLVEFYRPSAATRGKSAAVRTSAPPRSAYEAKPDNAETRVIVIAERC
jgi:hypothetical protein